MRAQLDVAAAFGGRLPELFAGFERGHPATPAAYPTSCSPQAWASAAPLLWLRSLLRIDPWSTQQEVRIAPELPAWIRRLRVDHIQIAGRSLCVNVDGGNVEISGEDGLDVIRTPRVAVGPTPSPDAV
jgi:glycogen debranching enzyme